MSGHSGCPAGCCCCTSSRGTRACERLHRVRSAASRARRESPSGSDGRARKFLKMADAVRDAQEAARRKMLGNKPYCTVISVWGTKVRVLSAGATARLCRVRVHRAHAHTQSQNAHALATHTNERTHAPAKRSDGHGLKRSSPM